MRRLLLLALLGCHGAPARAPALHAPCFPDQPTLAGDDARLEPYTVYPGDDEAGAAGQYGTCTVARGVVRAADGSEVASISCGIDWSVPGVIDDHGLGVGVRGDAVIASYGGEPIACQPNWSETPRVRCWVPDTTGQWDGAKWEYIVDGTLPGRAADDASPLEGEPARAFFASRTVAQLEYRGDCH